MQDLHKGKYTEELYNTLVADISVLEWLPSISSDSQKSKER